MSENIEAPDGWQPSGPCFTRVYGGKLAVLDFDPDTNLWYATIHGIPNDISSRRWLPLHEAVAWANEQLGVPKPVEVVEREFADGSVLVCDASQSRSARVRFAGEAWSVHERVWSSWPTKELALEAARSYVRGDA